jgi:hypothetical protein
MAVKNKAEFENKYGAAPSELQNVLIGMKGGKAVYGTEMESKDTKGENVINNTYSQNQAIMNDMFKEMGRSGGMYNPSSKDIVAAERMSPITADDRDVTKRADGKELIGAESQQAANMRESPNADARFLQTLSRLNARPNRTSAAEPTQTPPPDLQKIDEEDRARDASPVTKGPAPLPAPLGSGGNVSLASNSAELPSIFSAEDVVQKQSSTMNGFDNAAYLMGISDKNKKNKIPSYIPPFGEINK